MESQEVESQEVEMQLNTKPLTFHLHVFLRESSTATVEKYYNYMVLEYVSMCRTYHAIKAEWNAFIYIGSQEPAWCIDSTLNTDQGILHGIQRLTNNGLDQYTRVW